MSQQQFGPTFEPEPIPPVLTFRLPDDTPVKSSQDAQDSPIHIELNGEALGSLVPQSRSLRTSPHGIVNLNRAESAPILRLVLAQNRTTISHDDLWGALYGLWLRKAEKDMVPFELLDDIGGATDLGGYLVSTGLAFTPPDAQGPLEFLLVRASFWQGAGASMARHWSRSPVAHSSLSPLGPFPFLESFTRGEHVLTTHPRRPPKPTPGSVLYARFICSVGQMLRLVHIDASNPEHFEAYQRWQNSDRVDRVWGEKGPEEKHRAYLADRLADPHVMGFIVEWDGELAGYGEIYWVKEDPMGTYVGGVGDYDQGWHILIGEEKFRGRNRFPAVITSMKHACFLRDPRTDVVVCEPRYDSPLVPRTKLFLPHELNREFEFPHKRAVYFVFRRHRFFQTAPLGAVKLGRLSPRL